MACSTPADQSVVPPLNFGPALEGVLSLAREAISVGVETVGIVARHSDGSVEVSAFDAGRIGRGAGDRS